MTLAHRYKTAVISSILYDFEICNHNKSKDLKRLNTWIHQQILNLPKLKRSLIRTFPAPVPSLVFCKHLLRKPWRNMGICKKSFLFVCPTREFFTHLETSSLPMKDCKFWPMLGTYGHWTLIRGFFSVPHLLLHGTSVYNDHLRGPVTLTHNCQALELSLLDSTTCVCHSGDSNTQPTAFGENALTHCAAAAASKKQK